MKRETPTSTHPAVDVVDKDHVCDRFPREAGEVVGEWGERGEVGVTLIRGLGRTKPARPRFSREKNPNSFSSADLYGAAAAGRQGG